MNIGWRGALTAFYRRDVVDAALKLTARACGVPYADLAQNRRKAPAAFARQVSMYLCHVVGDMSLRDVADALGRDRTTVSHACHAIEDRRECPIFDRQMEHLERELRAEIKKIVEKAAAAPAPWEKKSFRLAG